MPAIPSFINGYKSGWKAKAVIKSSLSRFNRSDTTSTPPPPSDVPQPLSSPAASTVLEIRDDRSSLDFDGGQPNEYENDILDRASESRSSRPSNVSSVSPPAKLEVTLPPELRIDWFAEKFNGTQSTVRKGEQDMNSLDQDTRDTLAGKIKDDQGLFETLEDALALHVDSNPSRFVSISGLDLKLPGMSPINGNPGALTIPYSLSDAALLKHHRDSLTMLTSRLSTTDTPASSALSGTTLARALISNTFAMPVDRLSTSQGEGGLARSDSSVLPRDSVHRNMFSIAPDAPPMPSDAEIQYVAPKKPRVERRKQLKRRSSTGSLYSKSPIELPTTSRRTSLVLSVGSELDMLLKSRPWSSGTVPSPSPRISIPGKAESTTLTTAAPAETTKSDHHKSSALPPLPEGVRRLPDPHSQQSTPPAVTPPISTSTQCSSPCKELDTTGLEDVLEYYNLGESPAPHPSGSAFRPDFSPIIEETSSQASSASSPFWNDRRDSKRVPPVGARSPRIRGESMPSARRPSDARPPSKQTLMLVPSQNDSSAGLSERSGSLKSSRSFEPQHSDSASSHHAPQDTRNQSRQRSHSIPLLSSSGVEASEDSQRSNDDSQRVHEDPVSAYSDVSQSSGRPDPSHSSDAPVMNLNSLPPIPTTPMKFSVQPVLPLQIEVHSSESSPSRTGLAAPLASHNLSVPSPLVRSRSLPPDGVTFTPTFVISAGIPSSNPDAANDISSSSRMTVEKSVFSRYPAASEPAVLSHHHLHPYKDDFLGRNSTLSMGSPPPYYEAVNQGHIHHPIPPTVNGSGHVGRSPSDPLTGPSRFSEDWHTNDPRRESPLRSRIRARPPLPIGPRRPSNVTPPSTISFSESLQRSASFTSGSRPSMSRQRSTRVPAVSSPKFHTPPPKWRGHTMDAARWTFKSSQLQAIVSRAIKQSSEASSIRLLEPEILNDDIPAEMTNLETLRTDIKTRFKLLARRRAVLFDSFSSFLNGNAEEGPGYAHRLLEEMSEIAATMDHLSEELHSADSQLAQLDSLIQVHTSSALAMALRKLNTSFLKQMAENESLRNELFSVEAERDEAWLQAERIAIELDQLAEAEKPSPIASNRSSRGSLSAHRKSIALASKAGLKVSSKRSSGKRLSPKSPKARPVSGTSAGPSAGPFTSPALSSKGFRPEIHILPPTALRRKPGPIKTESALASSPILYDSPSPATKALIQTQDELYAMLGLAVPETNLKRSQSWRGTTPRENDSPPLSHTSHSVFLSSDNLHLYPQTGVLAKRRSASLPPEATLAQFSNAMAADRNAMLFTFDMLSIAENDSPSR